MSSGQKFVQLGLVWLLPVLGPVLVGVVFWSNYEPRTRRLSSSDDVEAMGGIGDPLYTVPLQETVTCAMLNIIDGYADAVPGRGHRTCLWPAAALERRIGRIDVRFLEELSSRNNSAPSAWMSWISHCRSGRGAGILN